MRLLVLPFVLVIALSLVPAADAAAFRSPSGNIGCMWVGGELRCDIGAHRWTGIPRKPAWCHFDWALGFRMNVRGHARWVCGSDTVLGIGPVLGYGRRWHRPHISCRMRTTGLTCRNQAGHGFFMSRGSWRLF